MLEVFSLSSTPSQCVLCQHSREMLHPPFATTHLPHRPPPQRYSFPTQALSLQTTTTSSHPIHINREAHTSRPRRQALAIIPRGILQTSPPLSIPCLPPAASSTAACLSPLTRLLRVIKQVIPGDYRTLMGLRTTVLLGSGLTVATTSSCLVSARLGNPTCSCPTPQIYNGLATDGR